MKVVKVLWVDSCNSNMNWTVAEDIEIEPMYIDSFGVVVKDTDEFLAIAQNYGDNPEQYSNITTIPKGCIKEVFVIHEDNVCETAWSKEDEAVINKTESWLDTLCDYLKDSSPECIEDVKDIVKQLKSLRPHNRWKPSEEHIHWLKWAINRMPDTEKANEAEAVLEELLEQLKKLKE